MLRILALVVLAFSAVAPLAAQLGTKKTLTLAAAQKIGDAAVKLALAKNATGSIAIVDDGGHLMFLVRIDGTFPSASEVATGKATTAAMFRKGTKAFEESIVKNGRTSMIAVATVTRFTPLEGGVPIIIDGQVIGAIGISGTHSADEDEEIAQLAISSTKIN
jgi:glc operon protein GlcG